MNQTAITILISLLVPAPAAAQTTVPVTVDSFARAESDRYMGRISKDGGLG